MNEEGSRGLFYERHKQERRDGAGGQGRVKSEIQEAWKENGVKTPDFLQAHFSVTKAVQSSRATLSHIAIASKRKLSGLFR